MTAEAWLKTCVEKILEFYGEGARKQAENSASEYLGMQSLNDDPVAAAILIMEGWSYTR